MTDSESENFGSHSVYRILDAAINRAGEGIRVVEDYARMVIQDEHLSRQLKQLRHDLTQSVESIDPQSRMAARDTVGDVGCKIETESEYKREPVQSSGSTGSGAGLIQANMARTQQAIRTIEEFSKTLDPAISKNVEQLRYRTYTIEKAILTTVFSRQKFEQANLYVLIDGCGIESGDESRLTGLTESLIQSGVDVIQLRDKNLNDKRLVVAGRVIEKLTRETNTRFVMNDRPDLAVAAQADGVHLGQDDLDVAQARRIVGAARIIGVSTHSIEQARQAVLDGANYIGVGPVFASTTKSFDSHVGLELVKNVSQEIKLPAFAIGGINQQNVLQIVEAGLSRVAVSAAIVNEDDPSAAALGFKEKLKSNKN